MNILVVGCGNLGARLAKDLCHQGHDVAVIDQNEENFDRLGENFDGIKVVGIAMDIDVLKNAGVESCEAAAIVTADDNLNITISQVIKEFFGVKNVVSRIINPARQKVFKHFGLITACQTSLVCDAMFSLVTQDEGERQLTFGDSTVGFNVRPIDSMIIGRSIDAVPTLAGERIIGVIGRKNKVEIYDGKKEIVLNQDDRLIYAKISN